MPALATTFGVASLTRADITAEGEAAGTDERYLAAAPDTCGAAIDVPFLTAYRLPGIVDRIPSPGAAMSTDAFCELKNARASAEVVAPTATTPS